MLGARLAYRHAQRLSLVEKLKPILPTPLRQFEKGKKKKKAAVIVINQGDIYLPPVGFRLVVAIGGRRMPRAACQLH